MEQFLMGGLILICFCIFLINKSYELKKTKEQLSQSIEAAFLQKIKNKKLELIDIVKETGSREELTHDIQNKLAQQSTLVKLGQYAIVTNSLDKLMNKAVEMISSTLKMEYSQVLEILPNNSAFLLKAGTGWHKNLVGVASIGLGHNCISEYAYINNEIAVTEDLLLETRFRLCPLLHNHNVVSGVAVKIATEEQSFGVLGVYSTQERKFNQDELNFVEAVAKIIAAGFERAKQQERLSLFERAIHASSNGIVITDALEDGNPIIYVNPAFERITGYESAEVVGKNCNFLQGQEKNQSGLNPIRSGIREGRECQATLKNYRKNGEMFWNELHIAPVHNSQHHLTHFIGVQTDISERKQAEESLQLAQFCLDHALESVFLIKTTGKIYYVNESAYKSLDYSRDELLHLNVQNIFVNFPLQTWDSDYIPSTEQFGCIFEGLQRKKNGELFPVEVSINYLEFQGQAYYCAFVKDITERKELEERLLRQALYDNLTKLPNRSFFTERLSQAIKHTKKNPAYKFAVLFLDLDRFKVVNDSAGHHLGDQLLIAIAQVLESCCSPKDTVARLGGDEFTILVEDIQNQTEAITLAEKIQGKLKTPIVIDTYEVFTSASIGIAFNNPSYDTPEDMLRDADLTMYQAKQTGRGTQAIFHQVMHTQLVKRLNLERKLHRALEQKELSVYYQPIISLQTLEIKGFEALMRWQHPQLGFIPPDQFIPIAEETGLIISLGEWILTEACQQIITWQNKLNLKNPLSISVNICGRQLKDKNVVTRIERILKEVGLDSKQLKLEITESMLMEDMDTTTEILGELRQKQIQLCIDDFGTGYSSLSYLHRFPINTLKIDRSFVSRIGQGGEKSEIVKTIINLAQSLDMDLIAEGIETEHQLKFLQQMGCEQGQGYYISQPLEAKLIEEFLVRVDNQAAQKMISKLNFLQK